MRKFKHSQKYDEDLKEKFKEKYSLCPETGCWNWKKGKDKLGRGYTYYGGKHMGAHRVFYILYKGQIPPKMVVCHKCDNYKCVNPEHLFLGTQQDNVDDRQIKNRGARGERIGMSKLKEHDVIKIREMKKSGLSQQKIGELFGVSQTAIGRILNNDTWKHICHRM